MTEGGIRPSGLSIRIRSLRAQNEGSEVSLSVLLGDAEHSEQRTLVLKMEQYLELKPTRGEISEELFDRLEEAALFCSAQRCGEHLLAYGANSVQMLTRKIVQHGFSRDLALRAATSLQQKGLIDEDKDLRRETERCLRKLWGSRRISAHLWSRGFAAEALEALPEILSEVDFAANCATLVRKHYGELPGDAEEMRRMTASLTRYGYSISEIRAAFSILRAEAQAGRDGDGQNE